MNKTMMSICVIFSLFSCGAFAATRTQMFVLPNVSNGSDGQDGKDACAPKLSSETSGDCTTIKSQKQTRNSSGVCENDGDIEELGTVCNGSIGAEGIGVCDGATAQNDKVRSLAKQYSEHTDSAPGKYVLTQTMCVGEPQTFEVSDECTEIYEDSVENDCGENTIPMRCTDQTKATNQEYKICEPIGLKNASAVTKVLKQAKQTAEAALPATSFTKNAIQSLGFYDKDEVEGLQPNVQLQYDNGKLQYRNSPDDEWSSIEIEGLDGQDGKDACAPKLSSETSGDCTTIKSQKQTRNSSGVCENDGDIEELGTVCNGSIGAEGIGVCDGATAQNDKVRSLAKQYSEHTDSAPGKYVLTQTMCVGEPQTFEVSDECTEIYEDSVENDCGENTIPMRCTDQTKATNQEYKICEPIGLKNASAVTKVLKQAKQTAEAALPATSFTKNAIQSLGFYDKDEVEGLQPNVQLQYDNGKLQYRNSPDDEWSSVEIEGLDGEDGKDGCSTYVKNVANNQNIGNGKTGSVITLAQTCPEGVTPKEDTTVSIAYGEKGDTGAAGKSALTIWQETTEQPDGTAEDFLASLKGAPGESPTIQMVEGSNTIQACYGNNCTDIGTISLTNLCTSMYSDKTGTDERGDVYTMYCCIGDDCCQGTSCKPDTPVD